MGIAIPFDARVPGLRVRHRRQLWTGAITQVMDKRFVIEVAPDGLDGPGRPLFFDADEFERADLAPARALVDGEGRRAERYLTDAVFYNLVNILRQGLVSDQFTIEDIREATLVAEVLNQQARRRRAAHGAGNETGHATTERGTHGPAITEPGGTTDAVSGDTDPGRVSDHD